MDISPPFCRVNSYFNPTSLSNSIQGLFHIFDKNVAKPGNLNNCILSRSFWIRRRNNNWCYDYVLTSIRPWYIIRVLREATTQVGSVYRTCHREVAFGVYGIITLYG